MLYGSAAGTATRLGAAASELSVLSLSADGALAMEQLAVPAGTAAAALGTGAGAVYVLMGPAKPPAPKAPEGFKSFTEGNFRENLARLTGQLPESAHAHHVFPQGLANKFRNAGINIHDPRFGAWWERSQHLKNSFQYTRLWEQFMVGIHSADEILAYGRQLAKTYGFQVNF